ncbi:FxSxx-COOH system tetratricopeptide repeat protein [Kitasatospora sp. P5_F3]
MTQGNRGGRPFGPVRAESREAAELAEFLRDLVRAGGRTLTELAGALGRSQGTVSEYLAGRVPDETFVKSVVAATSRDHRDQIRALTLLRAARNPAPQRAPVPRGSADPEERQGHLESLFQRLTQAEGQRDELRVTLDTSNKLVMLLVGMLNKLQERVGELTEERNTLLGHREEIARLYAAQQQLERAHGQERQAVGELIRVEARRSEAERLLAQVLEQVGRLSGQVASLEGAVGARAAGHSAGAGPVVLDEVADPVGEDIGRALARVSEINEADERTVRRITDELDLTVPQALTPPPEDDEEEDEEPDQEHGGEGAGGRIVTFYSYRGGAGRTMALANCAWILAANGYRVLAVDWDLEAPGLHHYFHPFLDPAVIENGEGVVGLLRKYRGRARKRRRQGGEEWLRRAACVRSFAHTIAWTGFPGDGRLDLLPGGRADAVSGEGVDFLADAFVDALREDFRHHYDYVLIDSQTGASDLTEVCLVQLPDDLVVCFTLGDQSIAGASEVARFVQDREIRVLPVPTRVDDGEKEKADAGRALARARFSGLPEGLVEEDLAHYWGSVEIPYRPFYAYEQILATFGDQPGMPTSMLAACERLTGVITEGRVAALAPVNEELRLRYLDAFTRRGPVVPADVCVSYVPEDRTWADWIESVLTRAGFRVLCRNLLDPDPRQETLPGIDATDRTVVVLSAAYLRAPQARALGESAVGSDPSGRELVVVRVGDVRPTAPFSARMPVDLIGRDEPQATQSLLRALGRSDVVPDDVPGYGPRFPGTRPSYWSMPQRNPSFTGRAKELEELREQLVGGPMVLPTPQALYGLGGVGKTQLAIEYAHRYMSSYDLVWWIDAEQTVLIPMALAELAARLGLRVGDSVNEAAEAAREALQWGNPTSRWLLIFDNADEPDEIRRFLPGGSGHILVTSRNQAWSEQAGLLEVDVFTRAESVEHLTRRTRGLSRADADRVAEAVGDLPLAVEAAAAWLDATRTPVDTYIHQLQQASGRALAVGGPADYPTPVGAAWNVSIARLSEQSPAAVRLLQLCAFFAPEPISMDLFHSDQMIKSLAPYDPTLTDTLMLARVLQAVGRYALVKVDTSGNSFQMHRLVQAVVRSEMDESAREDAMHEVHRILVGARPALGDTDNPANWPRFEKIWPHLAPSGAQDCDERETRELLTDRVRYLWQRGELDRAGELGAALDAAWTGRLGESDPQTLLLRVQIANVQRSQGEFAKALALDEATLARQRALLGEHHPYTLMTAASLGADLRALGRFDAALDLDREILDQFRELFGDDNTRTLSMANNLAIDHRLVGDSEAARALDQDIYDRRTAVLGATHPNTLASKSDLARDLRDLGDYKGSIDLLRELAQELADVPQADQPEDLRNAKSLAVSLRQAGRLREAGQLTRQTYERHLERYGGDTPDALACALNLAADHSAAGDQEAARDLCLTVLDGHRRLFGKQHPFTLVCGNNLGRYLLGSGDVEGAIGRGRDAVAGLSRSVGTHHPYTLNAMVNLACSFGAVGHHDEAEQLELAAYQGLSERYGVRHPDAVACRANLAVTLRDQGRLNEAVELRADALAALLGQFGDEHPYTVAVRHWRRISRDLEVQPL